MRTKSRQISQQVSKDEAQVDIVTLTYGHPDMFEKLYKSILTVDAGVKFRWIIVDNCSPAKDKPALNAMLDECSRDSRVQVVYSRINTGFAGGCNVGSRYGKAPYILLLNSDIIVTEENWLAKLVDNMRDATVGIVGTKLRFFADSTHKERPAGKIQHAGVAFNILGAPYHIFMGWSADHPLVNRKLEMNCVTGACLLIRRKLYELVKGLDEDYTLGNFEDVALCLAARDQGYKVIYDPSTYLYHYAGGSGNSATVTHNAKLLSLKSGHLIEYDEYRYYPPPSSALPARAGV